MDLFNSGVALVNVDFHVLFPSVTMKWAFILKTLLFRHYSPCSSDNCHFSFILLFFHLS